MLDKHIFSCEAHVLGQGIRDIFSPDSALIEPLVTSDPVFASPMPGVTVAMVSTDMLDETEAADGELPQNVICLVKVRQTSVLVPCFSPRSTYLCVPEY